jgi:hypothetical protein
MSINEELLKRFPIHLTAYDCTSGGFLINDVSKYTDEDIMIKVLFNVNTMLEHLVALDRYKVLEDETMQYRDELCSGTTKFEWRRPPCIEYEDGVGYVTWRVRINKGA